MKFFLLIATAAALVANGAYAQEYRGSEVTEMVDALEEQGVQLDTVTEDNSILDKLSGFLRGSGNGGSCDCTWDDDCSGNKICRQANCAVPYSGPAYNYGQCVNDNNNGNNDRSEDRACNYKQCTNKDNGSCECQSGYNCVKGGDDGSNTCTKTDDLNGCCVPFAALDGSGQEE